MPLIKRINEDIKDERKGNLGYKRLATKSGLNKTEKKQIRSMAKDEKRHEKTLIKIKKRITNKRI